MGIAKEAGVGDGCRGFDDNFESFPKEPHGGCDFLFAHGDDFSDVFLEDGEGKITESGA